MESAEGEHKELKRPVEGKSWKKILRAEGHTESNEAGLGHNAGDGE